MDVVSADRAAGGVDEPPGHTQSPSSLAAALLVACKREEPTAQYTSALARLDDSDLAAVRTDRETGLAFWLNCYNAGTQLLLSDDTDRYGSPLRSLWFFSTPAITVAGTDLSLDRIEHGILRSGRSKYGLGYLPKLLVTTVEHRYRLARCDPRIHFALNCGAASCPPIRAYDPAEIDAQLDLATRSYLDSTVEYDPGSGVVEVPRLFRWFPGDFGGKAGIRAFLREYEAIPADASPDLSYQSWDWSKTAGAFVDGG